MTSLTILVRSPDEEPEDGLLFEMFYSEVFWDSLLAEKPHKEITKRCRVFYPSGFIISGYANEDTDEVYDCDIKVLN